MRPAVFCRMIVPMLMVVLVACGTPESVEPTAAAINTAAPTAVATAASTVAPTVEPTATQPTATPAAPASQLSFTPTTYTDASAGFELLYPAEWTLDPTSQVGVRGGQALLLSPGTTVESLADGGTRLSITTYVWDPKRDLDAYVAQRKSAWEASGFAITREEQWQFADGHAAYVFVVQTPQEPTLTLLTTIGEDYLQISGEGDLALVEEITRTWQLLN